MQIARVPFSFEEDGSLFFFGQIRDYERLRFSYGIKADILQNAATASTEMEEFAPQALLLVICPNRPLCLGKDEHKEIEFYHAVNPNLAYVYGACEFLQYHGAGGVLNSVLLEIGMREGDKPDQNGCGKEPCQRYDRDTESIPLADRFAVFLNAMTSELEEMAKEAKAASEAKSAFLSNMSHEIRTPPQRPSGPE